MKFCFWSIVIINLASCRSIVPSSNEFGIYDGTWKVKNLKCRNSSDITIEVDGQDFFLISQDTVYQGIISTSNKIQLIQLWISNEKIKPLTKLIPFSVVNKRKIYVDLRGILAFKVSESDRLDDMICVWSYSKNQIGTLKIK